MIVFDRIPTFIIHRAEERFYSDADKLSQDMPASVDWIEIDVRRTKDAVPVVFHDETISTGKRTGSLNYGYLSDLGVRSLEEFLQDLPNEINVVLDVKNSIEDATSPYDKTTGWVTVQAIKKAVPRRSILMTSFDPAIVARIQQDDAPLSVGLTTWQGVPLRESIPTATSFDVDVLAVHINALRPYGIELGDSSTNLAQHVNLAHKIGLQLACWGGEQLSRAEVDYLTQLGVDAIFMDERNIRTMDVSG